MNNNRGLPLPAPRVTPVLDPAFRPAVLVIIDNQTGSISTHPL